MIKIAVICPVYNEEDNIKLLIIEFIKLNNILKKKYLVKFVFINDGSTDHTRKIILEESKKFNNIEIINFTKNFGYTSAMTAGLEKINADFYACIDGDLQKDPNHILSMLKVLVKEKTDVVQMVTKKNNNYEGKIKIKLSILYYRLLNHISESKIVSGASDFWLIKKKVRNKLLSNSSYLNFARACFPYFKFKIHYINYKAIKRKLGVSKFNLKKQIELAFCGILLFMKKKYYFYLILIPLCIFFLTYFLYTILTKLFNNNFTIIEFFLIIISFISIILLSNISIMLFRAFNIIKKKPNYIVKKT